MVHYVGDIRVLEIFYLVNLSRKFRGHCSSISCFLSDREIEQFRDFLIVDEAKTRGTAEDYCRWMRRFSRRVDSVSVASIRSYLKDLKENWSVHYYCCNLSALKAYFGRFKGYPELVTGFKFPFKPQKLKAIPSKEDLQRFYEALPSLRTEAYFLVTVSSGLRRGEVLSLEAERDVDFDKRMLTPINHMGSTKHSWVSFYNEEAEIVLMEFRSKLTKRQKRSPKLFPFRLMTFKRDWKVARQKTGLHITPKVLRDWFCSEMGELGVPDRYIDAFCGRVPRSILARHYTDYSPKRLKRIYDKAGLRVLA